MSAVRRWSAVGLAALLLLAGSLAAYGQAASAGQPAVEDLLRKMSQALKQAEAYRFHAEIQFDDVLPSGQKLQYAGAVDLAVRHPDGVFVDYRDGLSAKRFWYDGKTGTLLDVAHEKYAIVQLPDRIDAAVDQLAG